MSNYRNICIVFDIDETLLQFLDKRDLQKTWNKLTEEEKSKFDYIDNGNIIIFRPHIKELFKYLVDNSIKFGIWTRNTCEYAEYVANLVGEHCNLPEGGKSFIFKLCYKDYGKLPKDLNLIYSRYPQFNKFNTFIIDDLEVNINHKENINNSLFIQSFAPFGFYDNRISPTKALLKRSFNDNIFLKIKKITQKVKQYIDDCTDEEIIERLDESVFSDNRVKKMGLQHLSQPSCTIMNNIMKVDDDFTIGGVKRKTFNYKKKFSKKRKHNKRIKTRKSLQ